MSCSFFPNIFHPSKSLATSPLSGILTSEIQIQLFWYAFKSSEHYNVQTPFVKKPIIYLLHLWEVEYSVHHMHLLLLISQLKPNNFYFSFQIIFFFFFNWNNWNRSNETAKDLLWGMCSNWRAINIMMVLWLLRNYSVCHSDNTGRYETA